MAVNDGTLDETDPSDWIELWNRSSAPVDLRDWSPADDPPGPTSGVSAPPEAAAPPHDRLIVFASGKDRTRVETDDETGVTSSLHTNFGWAAAGGYLALFRPPPAAIWTGRPSTIRRNSGA
ncbi:MAG: hypothetical protein R2838_10340 [Caldilineaceae bacterium]